ncbi:MAG: histidine kinase [Deltaproteobacteria bacterium RBG_13_52_11b]|nr:MAG: histidine kinase [Deltaproteobacteria bacterium RBG_13_52_11b]
MRELSLHILDLLENAVEAGASRIEITIEEDLKTDWMVIEITDNGRGMSQELIERVLDPFYTTRKTRHVGLGLPLFLEAARRCGGDLLIQSNLGKGTRVRATFRHSHIDRAPLGDITGALMAILLSEHPVDLDYCHNVGSGVFRFDSSEIRKELENVPLGHPKVRDWLFHVLHEGEANLVDEREGRPLTL